MHALSASFFLQMAVILLACRLVGIAAKKIGQPQVVGEMIAGVMLGPSLLGHIRPGSTDLIFTKESRGILYAGAQLGVGLYMFLVGLEFRTDHFRSRIRSAASVSIAGMVVPFILGALLVLIIINIGLQRGIIGEALFSILVVMAIVTTLMASPVFEIVYGRKMRRGDVGGS